MDFRLNDDEMLAFIAIARGYHIFHPAIDTDIHQAVCAQTRAAFVEGKNPGNAIYEQVPALAQVLSHPQVVGALEALTDTEPFVRFNALGALMSMRPLDARCAEWFKHIATTDEAHPQWRAQDALSRWDNAALRY